MATGNPKKKTVTKSKTPDGTKTKTKSRTVGNWTATKTAKKGKIRSDKTKSVTKTSGSFQGATVSSSKAKVKGVARTIKSSSAPFQVGGQNTKGDKAGNKRYKAQKKVASSATRRVMRGKTAFKNEK